MPVWTLANMKGGVAKTTSALMLAQAAQQTGHRVLLVDLDLNAQLSRLLGHWPAEQAGAFADTPEVIRLGEQLSLVPAPGADFPLDGALAGRGLSDRLVALATAHDLCIIDTPSGYMPFLRELLRLSEVWITPTPLTPVVRQASVHYLLRMARLALAEHTRLTVRLLPVQFNAHLGSHRIGLEALRRFVGSWRVLPPVRQDAHLTGVLSDTAHRLTPARRDYLDVCRVLGVC
ncbi:ParA family protein [Sulfurivirga sp.]|uniref:ParA family protein n=1 Tax=Sulfurivirga sp. TaxID=2614236 RepID=UPI0025E01300|nr:ParA family protein [Sulfurivirga sp.]